VDNSQSALLIRREPVEFEVPEAIANRRCRRIGAPSEEQRELGAFQRVPACVHNPAAQTACASLPRRLRREESE
jgi:hypothetical protein